MIRHGLRLGFCAIGLLCACQSGESDDPIALLPATEALALSGSVPNYGVEQFARVSLVDEAGHIAVATFRFWRQESAGLWNWCANCDASLAQTCLGGVEFSSGEIGTLRFGAAGELLEFRQSDGSGVLAVHFDADPWRVRYLHLDASGSLGFAPLVQSESPRVVVHAIP